LGSDPSRAQAQARKHVTLTILWDEYIERCPEGYRYSRFCELYRNWASRLSVTMRQAHIGGDKLFVDYAGDTVPVIVERLTGQVRPAQIFVAVMGASNFTYAEASWAQALADWIGAHPRAFAALAACRNCSCRTTPRSRSKMRPRRVRSPKNFCKSDDIISSVVHITRRRPHIAMPARSDD
jgi:hypothetical protein